MADRQHWTIVIGEHLVGRDVVLAELRSDLEAAVVGRGGLALVIGEAGIGKTAVLDAMRVDAAIRSVPVAWGQCADGSVAPAFWPWVQVLRAVGEQYPDARRWADRLLPGAGEREAPADSSGDRFDLFDGVVSTLARASTERGLLVVLDDLHWADDASTALADFAATHLRHAKVLVLAAARDTDATGAVRRLTHAATRLVELDHLADDDVIGLVDALAVERLPADAVADVVRRAGGNPLFVRELVRLGRASGSVAERTALASAASPMTDVIVERLDRLSPACRTMLDVAAVLGTEVPVDALARVLAAEHPDVAEDLADVLDEAVRARILTGPPDDIGPYTFVHDVFREVVAGVMAPARAADLHARTGEVLDVMTTAGRATSSTSIAAHLVAAVAGGRRDVALDAVRHCRIAADGATRQLAFEEAVAHLRRGVRCLDLADEANPDVLVDLLVALLLDLAAALDRSGDATAARTTFVDAASLARRHGDPVAMATAAIGVHRVGAPSGLARDDTVRLLDDAVRALGTGHPALRARTLACLSRELHHTWDPEHVADARAIAHDAVRLARDLDDAPTLAACLLALHDAEWTIGSAAQRLPVIDEMLDLARAADDRELLAQSRLLRATALLELGDPAALGELERACRAAEQLGHARGRWTAQSRRAVIALVAGRFDEARDLGEAAARLGAAIGEPDTPGVFDTLQLEITRFRGGRADVTPGTHWVPAPTWPPLRSLLAAARDDHAAAREALAGYSVATDVAHGIRRHDGWMPLAVAESIAASGSHDQRVEAYEWLRQFAGSHVVYGGCIGYGGAIEHHLGVLARALGRDDDATRHLETAAAMHERLGATAWATLDRELLAGVTRSATVPAASPQAANELRREGDSWRVSFRGRSTSVRHVKGMLDLAVLLARPGREVTALELMGGVDVGGAPGPALDDRARRTYQQRIRELQVEIDDARVANDSGRAERAEVELDALVEQLSQAFGLGGHGRATGGAGERARAAVTHRIRAAIARIGAVDAQLAQHLDNAVKTGTWCVYRPDAEITWRVE